MQPGCYILQNTAAAPDRSQLEPQVWGIIGILKLLAEGSFYHSCDLHEDSPQETLLISEEFLHIKYLRSCGIVVLDFLCSHIQPKNWGRN